MKTLLKNIEIYQSQIPSKFLQTLQNLKYTKIKFLQSSFKPFHLKTLVHFPFPQFKTFLEGILWNLFELCRCSHFDGIDVKNMGFLRNRFDFREEKKVTRDQIRRIWGVFQSCNVFFCKKLLNTQGCVSRSVIMIKHPCVDFPKAPPFVTH